MKTYYFTVNWFDEAVLHIGTLAVTNNEDFKQKLLAALENHFDIDIKITNPITLEKCNEFKINRAYIEPVEQDDQIWLPEYVFIEKTILF